MPAPLRAAGPRRPRCGWAGRRWTGSACAGRCPAPGTRVAIRSGADVGRSSTARPSLLVRPTAWPPLMPPPASTTDQACGKWSRPAPALMTGVRPNSPIHTIRVESRRPRSPQVVHQRRPAGVEGLRQAGHALEILVVRVPALQADLHERHAGLHQPPGQEAALAKRRAAVSIAQLRRFVVQVEHARRLRSHEAQGMVVAGAVRLGRSVGPGGGEVPVHLLQQADAGVELVGGQAGLPVEVGHAQGVVRRRLHAASVAHHQRGVLRPQEPRAVAQSLGVVAVGRRDANVRAEGPPPGRPAPWPSAPPASGYCTAPSGK